MKTKYANILNALNEMKSSVLYAARRNVLAEAENIILQLESKLAVIEEHLISGAADETDIVSRLRINADIDEMEHCNPHVIALEREAADEIARLRAAVLSAPSEQDRIDTERMKLNAHGGIL